MGKPHGLQGRQGTPNKPRMQLMVWKHVGNIRGPDGPRGPEGAPGKFAAPKEFKAGAVHYEGALVTLEGSTWCATKDTAQTPPHEDWAPVALKGKDATTPRARGLWNAETEYKELEFVAHNGATWIALADNPGALPGPGWALMAQQGKQGKPGVGLKGDKGDPGKDAATIVDWRVDGFHAVPILSDGKAGPPLSLRAMFDAYHAQAVL
jgi:hypothetical protein